VSSQLTGRGNILAHRPRTVSHDRPSRARRL